jgi:predicted AlkP superfamily pyrophosphatase or phosphodiesterase
MPRRCALVLVAAAGCFRAPPPPAVTAPPGPEVAPPPRVKLAVVVVVDQLRADYLDRWKALFGPDGFARLLADGAWFENCHYPYATTTTGPGHASVLTGCSPDRHGIINNEWYDRAAGADVYCAGVPRYTPVPPDPNLSAKAKRRGAGSPDRLLSPTVADALKAATGGRGKVVGLSLKDRGAVLPCGKTPDGAYWFDDRFCTSTYYRDALPKWAAGLNASGLADQWFKKPWEKLRADVNYDRHAGADAAAGEGTGSKQGTTFPHPTDGGQGKPGPAYYTAVETSPFGNDLLLAAAKAAVEGEGLGADATPDLLVVSFSSNDLVGHVWGPDSQEVLDVTLRTDLVLADLLKYLDGKVGAGGYAVVLTADHGVCPLPEAAKDGRVAKRPQLAPLVAGAEAFLAARFGGPAGPKWVEAVSLPHVYLNHRRLKDAGVDPVAAAGELAGWLRGQPEVYRAYPRAEVVAAPAGGEDKILAAVRKSYHPDRGGDVFIVGRPFWLFGSAEYPTGTTHGSPHEYDTHVPLLVYGPGVTGGRRAEPVAPQQAAPIAAAFLGVPAPRDCEYGLPATLAR